MTISILHPCTTRISVQRNPTTPKISRCLPSSKLTTRATFGTQTLSHSRCHGFKIRISIIHKFINSLRSITGKTHLSNFLKLKGSTAPTTKTSKATSCLPTLPQVLGTKSTMKTFLTRTHKYLLQTREESQSRNTVNPSDKESLQLKTTSTPTRTTTSASSRTLIRT